MPCRHMIPISVVLLLGVHVTTPGSAPTAPADPGALVLVSQEEVRIVFPPEEAGDWSLPQGPCFNGTRAHQWRITIPDARVGTRFILLSFDRFGGHDCPATSFATLEDVVDAGRAGVTRPGMFMHFDSIPVQAGVEGNRVVLTLQDRQTIVDLFGLRPVEVEVWTRRAGEEQVRAMVPVTYLDPQIPEPDEAFLEESRALRWEWEVSFRRLSRSLHAEHRGPPVSVIEVAVGDSVGPEVHERYCTYDLCQSRFLEVPQAGWSVDDPEVARLSFREPPDLVAIAVHGVLPSSGVRIHGVNPGRTVLRLTGMTSAWDTVPSRPPMPASLDVEVIVTARQAGGG